MQENEWSLPDVYLLRQKRDETESERKIEDKSEREKKNNKGIAGVRYVKQLQVVDNGMWRPLRLVTLCTVTTVRAILRVLMRSSPWHVTKSLTTTIARRAKSPKNMILLQWHTFVKHIRGETVWKSLNILNKCSLIIVRKGGLKIWKILQNTRLVFWM